MQRKSRSGRALELWAGVECTVNRLGDRYVDQLERSGHRLRLDDLDRLAELGVRTVRYPILWETTAPDGPERADWSWADERLGRLRELGIRPIIGLVHHGSGPRHTSLVDPGFADGLAAYAASFAARYPWIEDYTPVNEPLTTARFSGLYGLWYPHGRDERTFAGALLTQCRAVVLAMRAVRRVNPTARLVQTEEVGRTFSTRALAYQASFDNNRRWLTFDLLCGRIDESHPLWGYLRDAGVPAAKLLWFRDNPCPPDILGLNYYLTSERFLDERLELYPERVHGGNGRDSYADTEAVRVRAEGLAGPCALLTEVWERYRLPVAITEVHNGCTREEQLRWLMEVWNEARRARREGVDVRAVTAWCLFGAYEWNSLLTRTESYYEPGVFDVRAPRPRPTALAHALRTLAAGATPDHPVLEAPGWWKKPERLIHGFAVVDSARMQPAKRYAATQQRHDPRETRPVIITGATGTLGYAFARLCKMRGLPYHLLARADMDIAEPRSVAAALEHYRPWAAINTAGYVRVDDAEREPERCFRENSEGPAVLAAACATRGVQLLTFSSDLVFDGSSREPYVESSTVAPLSVYGRSKAEAEARVLAALPTALVVRTSAFFGPWDRHNFVTQALAALSMGQHVVAADDTVVSPTYVPDLVQAALDLLIDGERGIWHLANEGAVTWAELARLAGELATVDTSGVEGGPTHALGLAAPRPLYSVLGSERGRLLPTLEDALARYLADESVRHGTHALV